MLPVPRLLTLRQVCTALPLRFTNTASLPCHKTLRLPRENDNSDTLEKSLESCACHTKRKRYRHTYLAKRNRSTLRARFCEDIDLQHVILITFKREHRPMVRLSDLRYAVGKKTANQYALDLGFEKHCLETPKRTTLI